MPTKITKTVYDGLLVTTAVSGSGIYNASRYNFLQALASLRQILPPEEYDKFLETSVPDPSRNGVVELSRGIGNQRSKRRFQHLSSRFEHFLQSILRFSTVIDVLVSSNPQVAALLWGSIKFVVIIALDYYDYFEQISRVFQRLGDLCPHFDRFAQLLPESDQLRESLADFYTVSVRFCTEALRFLQRSTFGHIMKAIWKPFNINFQDLEAEIQGQQVIVEREVRLASEEAAHRERQEASLYRSAGTQHRQEMVLYQDERRENHSAQMIRLEGIENLFMQQYVDTKKRKHKVLLAAISSYDHNPSFSNARDKRHHSTGLWLFDVSEFIEWSQKQTSCGLWCYGIPGAGKTILTAGAIDYLFLHHQGLKVSISYFFCEFGAEESTRVRTILRSLIKRILSVFEDLPPNMEQRLTAIFLGNQMHREPKMEELFEALLSATQLAATTYLIIDGLDECKFDDRSRLLLYMNKIIQDSKSRVKIIISSRAKVDIQRSLKGFYHIPLDSARNHSDIEKYICEVIDGKLKEEVLKVREPSMAEEIKKALIQGSQGMFLWVEFQIFEICRENNDKDIRRVLKFLPKGLDETYIRILGRIVLNHKPEVAKKIFTWLAVGKRPLSLDELSEAVAFNLGCLRWDQGTFQTDAFNMLRNCGNLVNHVKDGTVRFAHYTVLEFLISGRATAQFSLQVREADLYVGKICLMYLNFPDFETQLSMTHHDSIPATTKWVRSMKHHNPLIGPLLKIHPGRHMIDQAAPAVTMNLRALRRARDTPLQSSEVQVLCQKFCLLDYVAKNWIHHCSELPQDDKENWDLFADLVFHRTLPLDHLPLAWPRLNSHSNAIKFYSKMLLWAVEAGHPALLNATFSTSNAENISVTAYIEIRNSVGQTPMQLASSRKSTQVLEDLIVSGADVNAPTYCPGRTALQAAAEAGHLRNVDRLLEAKAEVNAEPAKEGGLTALQAAVVGGNLDIVNRLIEAGAHVNAMPANLYGFTALQAAATEGRLDIVNRLIEVGADVNMMPADSYGLTALQAAARGGHLDIVNRLIEAGANVNAMPANHGLTALQAAARGGHLDIVNRLIEAGAHANAMSAYPYDTTALQAAAGGGHLDILNRLIEAGAHVSAMPADSHNLTPLQAAATEGHLDIVNRLIEAGADVNVIPAYRYGLTALQAAARWGHLDIVNRLIEAGADVNTKMAVECGQTALQAAAGGGHLDIVNQLIEAGAHVNAMPADSYGLTALQGAATEGHLDIVNRLIEAGADANAMLADSHSPTALQAAARGGHLDIVNQLIEAGANVNAMPAENGFTALQTAARGGHLDIVNQLIEAGANVNAMPANHGFTALQAAAEGGHLDIVNQLIEAGANVNAMPAEYGFTVLQAAARWGYLDIVNRLIEAGADVNAKLAGEYGRTALQAAVAGGHLDIVNRLIKAKADINAGRSMASMTALEAAEYYGHRAIAERLRNAGAVK